jgi:predicted dehydrogenase
MTETLKVGLVGGGFMAKAHALAYAAMPMFYWPAPAIPVRYVIADVTDELAQDAAARFGFARSTSDWRRIVDDPEVDVVDIAVPNDLHEEIAIAAAEAGKHVLCEKPLARTSGEARRMADAVREAGVTNMVAFNYRRTPAVLLAREIIQRGEIGRILNFRGTYLQDWSADPESPLSWRFRQSVAGSGAVGDIASHVLDIARFLVGDIAAVNAMVKRYIDDRPVQAGHADALGTTRASGAVERGAVDVDDEVMTLLRFADGAVGSLEATRNAYGRNNFITFEIHGERGSLAFNYERRDELQLFDAGDPSERRGFRTIYTGPPHPHGPALWPIPALGIGYGETKIIECHDFVESVVTGRPAAPSFEDGWAVAAICDALLTSGEQGAWVELDSVGASA